MSGVDQQTKKHYYLNLSVQVLSFCKSCFLAFKKITLFFVVCSWSFHSCWKPDNLWKFHLYWYVTIMSGEYLQASEANHKNQKIKTSSRFVFWVFLLFVFFYRNSQTEIWTPCLSIGRNLQRLKLTGLELTCPVYRLVVMLY